MTYNSVDSDMQSKKLDSSAVLSRAEDVIFRDTGDGGVGVIKLNDVNSYYKIDHWAAEIWRQIDGKRSVDKILDIVQSKSALSSREVSKKGQKVLADLIKLKLARKSKS